MKCVSVWCCKAKNSCHLAIYIDVLCMLHPPPFILQFFCTLFRWIPENAEDGAIGASVNRFLAVNLLNLPASCLLDRLCALCFLVYRLAAFSAAFLLLHVCSRNTSLNLLSLQHTLAGDAKTCSLIARYGHFSRREAPHAPRFSYLLAHFQNSLFNCTRT